MKCNRVVATVLSAVMLISMAACGGNGGTASSAANASSGGEKTQATASSAASDTAKKLTIWAWDDTFNVKAANEAKAAYAKINPDVTVSVVSMAQNDIVAKLNTAFESGNMDGMPNIVLIEDYRIQNYLKSYPGVLSDLSDVTKADKFMDYKLKTMTEDGKIYGVPFDSGVACVFYRTDLLQKAGYKPADMENLTWDKFIEIGKAVKAKTGKAMLSVDPSDLGLIRMMMQSAGKWYVDADGKADIAGNPALKEALTIYKKMQTAGITITASGWDAGVAAVNEGKVATAVNGCWYASSIKKATDQSGKWAVASFPKMSNVSGAVNATNCGGASWYVIDKVPGRDTAKDFLSKTFASDTELLDNLCKDISLVSTYKDASSGKNVSLPDAFFSNQAIYKDWIGWTKNIPAVNYGTSTYDIENKMTEVVQSILKGASLDDTLKNAQTEVEGIVSAAG
ncbi:MAG TPA: ABC transporter substrate-binding protein [Ruminococcaceae bacterium]|nr:ABC transporter substrate-binding protein [Oscillospiraceae bacterium]HBG55278.1 ABC transporter substrate-binding protein [Oscillospiraceae bacterium]HBQ47114.1 ABC transporter substrate-binding protein [Oscillospiraceae bacterium]HBT90691.1 ABC transporter substrate-binding protein [Oscillospiraceae bacterium]HCB90343.1 ABC transporter substrate-binding protein [Oscillospiraceae bacterium]